MDELNFQSFFNNRLRERGYTLEKLAKVTGIAIKHLENLSAGNMDALPAMPYLRGYLVKIAAVLDFDPEVWWAEFKHERIVKTSGAEDRLPRNRFAREAKNAGRWIIGGIALLLLAYFGLRYTKILGKPTIHVQNPSESVTVVQSDRLLFQGTVENADQLSVKGAEVPIGDGGVWEQNIILNPGLNSIEIRAKKILGRETVITRSVVYQPANVQPPPPPQSSPTPPPASTPTSSDLNS